MKIAIDIAPLHDQRILGHRVRGTGTYVEGLKNTLPTYYSEHKYIFFQSGELLPQDVDVIHYPYFEPFFLTLPIRQKAATVVTVHDLTPFVFPTHFPAGIKGQIKWQVQKFLLQRTNAIITDSENSKKDIHKYTGIPLESIHVVYLAAEDEFEKKSISKTSTDRLRKKYNLPLEFALYVGDTTWNKNLPQLLNGVEKAGFPLVMVGKALVSEEFDSENSWNKDLTAVQKELEGNKDTIRLGFVETDDLVMLYNMATVFVMPSLYEGFGLPILEAMSCGTPVITARSGSIPEVANESVLYVDPYSSDDIARGIKSIFLDKDLQKDLSEKGLQQAKKFTWKETAKKTVEVYKKVILMS